MLTTWPILPPPIVALPPSDTALPLSVIELLANLALVTLPSTSWEVPTEPLPTVVKVIALSASIKSIESVSAKELAKTIVLPDTVY